VTDEEDFARNSRVYSYPTEVREAARGVVSALVDAVRSRHAPSDRIGLLPFS